MASMLSEFIDTHLTSHVTRLTPVVNNSQVRLPEVKPEFKTKRQVEREAEDRETKRVWIGKEN
jgi:hypothetical protein